MNGSLTCLAWRLILCHKHEVSARLHFLVPRQGVVLPVPLPKLSVIADDPVHAKILLHPSHALRQISSLLGLGRSPILVPEFNVLMEIPGGYLTIWLAYWPDYHLCQSPEGTQWIEFLDSVAMPWLDRELLRLAYEILLG